MLGIYTDILMTHGNVVTTDVYKIKHSCKN